MKRYDLMLVGGYGYRSSNEMVEQEGGEWVRFEDVEALKAENERIKDELARLKATVMPHIKFREEASRG